MKLYLTLIGLLMIFSSCNHVYFTETQPKGGERQSEIPKELYGTWISENERFQINEHGYTNIDINTDSLGTVIDTSYQTFFLSDSLRIYKAKELYVLNTKDKTEYWEIVILEIMNNGDINAYFTSDPEIWGSAKGLKLETANYYIDGEEKNVRRLNPDFESSYRFNSAIFSGQMKIKTLRKVLTKINPTTLKKDGSIYIQSDTIQDIIIEND